MQVEANKPTIVDADTGLFHYQLERRWYLRWIPLLRADVEQAIDVRVGVFRCTQ